MRFTDPNLFVHVRYNQGKNRAGRSLRVYKVVEANANVKITTLKSLGKFKGPLAEELIFDDGSRVEGAHYQKLLDFLKERDLYVNCLGRVLVTSVLRRDPPRLPPPQSPEIDCLRVFDYFPWHAYGGPHLKFDKSWVALDLEQNKKVDGGQDEEKKLHDEINDLKKEKGDLKNQYNDLKIKYEESKQNEAAACEKEKKKLRDDIAHLTKENGRLESQYSNLKKQYDESKQNEVAGEDEEKTLRDKLAELQQKYDDLEKKHVDLKEEKEKKEEIPPPQTSGDYALIDDLPIEISSSGNGYSYIELTPEQIGSKDYGVSTGNGIDQPNVNFQGKYFVSGDGGVARIEIYSQGVRVALLCRVWENGSSWCKLNVLSKAGEIKFVDRSIWKRIYEWDFDARPGSIWYA